MTTTIKGFAAAQRHKGGYDKWVYDMIKALFEENASLTERLEALEAAEETPEETPEEPGETPGGGK